MTTASAHVACCASILARRPEGVRGLKGQSCSTSGTTMEARTILTQKKKKKKKKLGNLQQKRSELARGACKTAKHRCGTNVLQSGTQGITKKRKILSIDHQASWQRQLCGVCHRRFSSSQSAIKDADAELNPFKGRR